MEPLVLCQHDEPAIAMLTLNRPAKRNALTIDLMKALCEQVHRLEADEACRVVILRGAGPAFCAGLDLIEAAERSVAEESASWVAQTFTCFMQSPLVTIASVQGAAMAGGAGLMSACDLVVASDDVRIGFPEVRRGLVPALVSAVLRGRLRDVDMRELFLLATAIDAQRAWQLGLVQQVVSREDLIEQTLAMARTVCLGGPQAVRQTKQLIRKIHSDDGSSLVDQALEIHAAARQSDEAEEGLKAFAERRDPRW